MSTKPIDNDAYCELSQQILQMTNVYGDYESLRDALVILAESLHQTNLAINHISDRLDIHIHLPHLQEIVTDE